MIGGVVFIAFATVVIQAVHIPEYFDDLFFFTCPAGFIQNGTDCLLLKSNICPQLNNLNKSYSITPQTGNSQAVHIRNNTSFCRYTMQEFMAVEGGGDSVNLNLVFDNSRKPFKLYLDVVSWHLIDNLENKVSCVNQKYTYDVREVQITEVFNSTDYMTRYTLQLNNKFRRYVCYFLDVGKIQPAFSQDIMASANANYVFNAKVEEQCFQNLYTTNQFIVFVWNSTHDDVYGMSNLPTLQEAISDFKTELSLLCNTQIVDVTNDKFCLPTENTLHWPLTEAGMFAASTDLCFYSNGDPLLRECIQEKYTARWINIKETCCDIKLSNETHLMAKIRQSKVNEETLKVVSDIVVNSKNITSYDLMIIADILDNSSITLNITSHEHFFKILDVIQNIDSDTIYSSYWYGSPYKMWTSVDTFVERLVREERNIFMEYPNIVYSLQPIFKESFSKSNTFLNILDKNDGITKISAQVKLSEGLWNILNLYQYVETDMTMAIVAYSERLFTGFNLESSIVDVMIYPKREDLIQFTEPLSIFFTAKATDVTCVFWDSISSTWLRGDIKMIRLNKDVVECQAYHLGRFGLMELFSN